MKTTVTVLVSLLSLPAFSADQVCEMIGQQNEFIVWNVSDRATSIYLTSSGLNNIPGMDSETVRLKKLGVFEGFHEKTTLFSGRLSQSNAFVSLNQSTGVVELTEYLDDKILNLAKKKLSDCQ